MSVDLESRLREALQARAGELEPDGRAWELVQARLRRARRRRVAAAGLAAAAAVAASAVAVPALVGSRVIEFDAPVADQPGEPSSREDGASGQDAQPETGARPAEEGAPGAEAAAREQLAAAEAQALELERQALEAREQHLEALARAQEEDRQRHLEARARAEQEARERAREAGELMAVEETRRLVAERAAAGDVAALRGLMAADFSFSFGHAAGRDEAAAHLEADPELLARLPELLDTPHGVVESGGQRLYVWPRAHALDPAEWTGSDLAVLRSLGATDAQIARWQDGEGYLGLRAGIDARGTWRFLVAGD